MKTISSKPFKLIFVLVAFFLSAQVPLRAGPLTNAFMTDRYFRVSPKKYSEKDKTAFRLGVLFPKIHYIAPQVKEATQFPDATLEDVINEGSAFVAGMKYLSFLERVREDFIVQNDYYSMVANVGVDHLDTFLKFLEDEIVCPTLQKKPWKDAIKYVHPDEQLWGVNDDVLKQWHNLLGYSFGYTPSTLIMLAYLKGSGLLDVPQSELSVWLSKFDNTAKKPEVKAYVKALLEKYEAEVR